MNKTESISGYKIAPVEIPVLYWSSQPLYKALTEVDRGSFYILSPLDFIEAIQEEGNYVIAGKKTSCVSALQIATTRLQCNDKTVVSDICGVSESVCTK